MQILIISWGYPTTKYHLNGIFQYDQAKALAKTGHEVIFAAIDLRSIRRWRKWGFEKLNKDGINIKAINFPLGRVPKFILNKFIEIGLRRLYSKIVHEYGEPDIIHSHFIGSGYASAKVFNSKKIPLVHTEHFSGMNQPELTDYYYNIGAYTYPRMDKVIVVSEHLKNNIKINYGIESTVIPNIVDVTRFKYLPFVKCNDQFEFISVGHLAKNKRMDLLIESFNGAFRSKKDVKLYIFGEGPERKNIESLIHKLNLNNQVFLMGQKERKIIAKQMQESDCFVLASRQETFGVAYIEALAVGVPVIATRCGGPETFVNDNNGLLVDVDNLAQLTEALKFVYYNIEKFNRAEISRETSERFSPDTVADQIVDVYNEILDKKNN